MVTCPIKSGKQRHNFTTNFSIDDIGIYNRLLDTIKESASPVATRYCCVNSPPSTGAAAN